MIPQLAYGKGVVVFGYGLFAAAENQVETRQAFGATPTDLCQALEKFESPHLVLRGIVVLSR